MTADLPRISEPWIVKYMLLIFRVSWAVRPANSSTPIALMANAMAFDCRNRLITIATSRSEEHTSELQSLMRISYAVFCLKKKKTKYKVITTKTNTSQDSKKYHNVHI